MASRLWDCGSTSAAGNPQWQVFHKSDCWLAASITIIGCGMTSLYFLGVICSLNVLEHVLHVGNTEDQDNTIQALEGVSIFMYKGVPGS